MWWKVASIGGTATNDTPPNNALQRTPSARAGACFVLAPWPSAPLKASVRRLVRCASHTACFCQGHLPVRQKRCLGTGTTAMPSQLRVRFGEAEHGWLPVEIVTPQRTICFSASHIPFDSLSELTTALLQTALTETPYQVRWMLEPVVYRFTFRRSEAQVQLSIHALPTARAADEQGTLLLCYRAPTDAVIRPFWRALRALESHPPQAQHWSSALPQNDMRRLEVVLAAA